MKLLRKFVKCKQGGCQFTVKLKCIQLSYLCVFPMNDNEDTGIQYKIKNKRHIDFYSKRNY